MWNDGRKVYGNYERIDGGSNAQQHDDSGSDLPLLFPSYWTCSSFAAFEGQKNARRNRGKREEEDHCRCYHAVTKPVQKTPNRQKVFSRSLPPLPPLP